MQKLVHGIHKFRNGIFHSQRDLFHRLGSSQKPAALFITCSDSRVNPNLLTQTDPGDLFVLRNAGNIIPPPPATGGELATIEFAVKGLGIRDIIICGHADCGAMKGLLKPDSVASMPAVAEWLGHARRTAEIIETEYRHLDGNEAARLTATVEENVVVQIENLRAHDFIESRLERGELNLHGWVYKFATAEVFHYSVETGQFVPLHAEDTPPPVYPRPEAVCLTELPVHAKEV